MSVTAVALTGVGQAHADVMATTVATSLSDGTNSGPSLTELAGTAVTDTATVSGANASGTVTYNVYSDSACTMLVNNESSTETVTAGTAAASAPVKLSIPGTYYWQAVYSGDSANSASSSTCGPNGEVETVSAGSTPTTVTTSLSGDGKNGPSISVPTGTMVTDQASLSGAAATSATGTVTYDVYSDSACTHLVNSGSPETITPGNVPASAEVTLNTPGLYYWQASYSGDATYASSISTCAEVETVTPAETSVSTSLTGGTLTGTIISVPAGTPVTDTATLSGMNSATATGSVTYTVYSDPTCTTEVHTWTQTITSPGMVPQSPQATLVNVGTYYWQAAYSGDTDNESSVSACGPGGEVEMVTQASTSATPSLSGGGVTGAAITVRAGTAVTDTATLSGSDAIHATGSVTYTVYSDSACTTAVRTEQPQPIITAGSLPASAPETLTIAGTYYWQATYSGDANNMAYTTPCGSSGGLEMVTPARQLTSLTTELSGGGASGASISVPGGTQVTDAASLSGIDASVATGWVTYTVYSNSACTTAVSTGTPEPITTPDTLPASAAVSLSTPGTYYWQASYSGDANNAAVKSTCGPSGETEKVTSSPTQVTLTTSLLSSAKSGTSITVQAGTAVRDSAHLAGANAAKATGTVTYRVYSNATCTTLVASAGSVTVTGGAVPSSAAQSLSKPGTYYWTATYSGDSGNKPAAGACGAETEFVTPAPVVDAVSSARGSHTATVTVSTTAPGDLLIAFVSGRGPAGKSQSAAVSSGGLKWTLMGRENTGRGDAEVWQARAPGKLHKLRVVTTQRYTGSNVTLTVVAFRDAAGIGRHATFRSGSGAPRGALTTSKKDSWVFAVGDDWLNSVSRAPGSGQHIVYQSTDSAHDTYWVQATNSVTPNAGTSVTINDTKPAKDPYNLVLVEILWG